MDPTPTDNDEVHEKGRQVSQYCLRLPTILRRILEQFSTRELIKLSLVDKLWNFEARSVMRERGNLTANLWFCGPEGDNRCQRLVAFASDLGKMRVVPISGIKFVMWHRRRSCQPVPNESLDLSYNIILDRVNWKHFSILVHDDWDRCKDCPALVLVKRILENYCGVLEELTFGFGNEDFFPVVFRGRNLPCLEILKVQRHSPSQTNNFIKSLVSCAPNLRELHVQGDNNFAENILKGSSAVLAPHGVFRPLFNQLSESLVGSLRAKKIELLTQRHGVNPRLLNNFIPKLLEASRTSLKTLRMDLLFAVPLMCYGICLENVTKLRISLIDIKYVGASKDPILELPKGLDFNRVFPKLKEVKICDDASLGYSPDVVNAFVEQGNAVLSRALPDRAINIQTLDIGQGCCFERSTLSYVAQIFPDVKVVRTRELQRLNFALLREYFLCLEKVKSSMFDDGL